MVRRSEDGGKSWLPTQTVVYGTPEHGYGDAAMAIQGNTITMVFSGGNGLWQSNPQKMHCNYICRSTDAGRSWSLPQEITDQIHRGHHWPGGFAASGVRMVSSRGVIVFVLSMCTTKTWRGPMENVLLMSRDQGKTWQTSIPLRTDCDESKVMDLADGSWP